MLNYTLNIPQHRKVNKTNSNVVGVFDYKSIALPSELQGQHRKAYIYSRIESQDSFRLFFYAQNIIRIGEFYTFSIPLIAILWKYPLQNDCKIREKTPIDYLQYCYRYSITLL